jgi:tRNA-dihydrouridine synthase A
MMDWSDRHCRMFHRHISKHTRLYTEMVTTGALVYGDVERHLRFNEEEHPVALQLGGSDPADLATSAKLGEKWGYDEINLNCGCPSERVQKGAFGACLMAEPQLVADCVKAMRDAVSIDVTVKHRIGIDDEQSYGFVRDFVGKVAEAGCTTFIVHARNAILKGLSPKEPRNPAAEVRVRLPAQARLPDFEIIINGGIKTEAEIDEHLQHVDGVMLGREAYHNPFVMANFDQRYYGDSAPKTREQVLEAMIPIFSPAGPVRPARPEAQFHHPPHAGHHDRPARRPRFPPDPVRFQSSPKATPIAAGSRSPFAYYCVENPLLLNFQRVWWNFHAESSFAHFSGSICLL